MYSDWLITEVRAHLGTEAVADSSKSLNTQVTLDVLDGSLDDRVNVGRLVVREPSANVEFSGLHLGDGDGVAVEQVGDHAKVAIGSVLISEQLGVVEETENVTQEENSLLGGLVVLGVGDVVVHCSIDPVSGIIPCTQEPGKGNLPPLTFLTSPTGVPSCLKPWAQQAPGGLDAIVMCKGWWGGRRVDALKEVLRYEKWLDTRKAKR